MAKLDAEAKRHPDGYWREDIGFGTTRGEDLAERRQEIESMHDLNRYFGALQIYGVFDRFVWLLFQRALHAKVISNPKFVKPRRFLKYDEMKALLHQEFKTNLDAPPFERVALDKLNAVRNVIVHKGGWVSEDERNRFKGYGFKKIQPLELPSGFFGENFKLIRTTCQLILKGVEEHLESKGLRL